MDSIESLVTAIRGALDRSRDAGTTAARAYQSAEELRDRFTALGTEDKAVDANPIAAEIEVEDGTEPDFGAFAARLSVTPPDDRDGWSIDFRWRPAGMDLGLTWAHPDAEPVQQTA